jgi:hypothetical protein
MVTQVRGDYADIYEWSNLYTAFLRAARGKRGHPPAAAFEFYLGDNLIQLQDELADESYRPGPYVNFTIHEPKRRLISAAPFRDRVVHHALCNVIEPAFDAGFIHHSYANRVGKGTHRALDTTQNWLKRYGYVLQCDLRQFFPSIDHRILQRTLNRHIQDGAIRRLIGRILASGVGVLAEAYEMVYFWVRCAYRNNNRNTNNGFRVASHGCPVVVVEEEKPSFSKKLGFLPRWPGE